MADETSTTTRYSIHELSTLGGLPTRTVRFYISEGLIDRPEGAKRGAWYEDRHLQQLLRIRRWTDEGMSLDQVREAQESVGVDGALPRATRPGTVEVWSHITLADGLQLHVEPGQAGLAPEQVRALAKEVLSALGRIKEA